MTTVSRPGRPSARKRAPSAASVASGVFNPDEQFSASTAPSGTSATARSTATIFELIARLAAGRARTSYSNHFMMCRPTSTFSSR